MSISNSDDSSDAPGFRPFVAPRQKPARSIKSHRKPARPYPLLERGQDPASLDARVAFHLHRLKLTGRRLRDCGFCPTYHVAELTQARLHLGMKDVCTLAHRLGIVTNELCRPLTAQEEFEWRFYRLSASRTEHVWKKAQKVWEERGLSLTEAAVIMGIERSVVSRNTKSGNKRGYRVFPYVAAVRLAKAAGLQEGVMYFVAGD